MPLISTAFAFGASDDSYACIKLLWGSWKQKDPHKLIFAEPEAETANADLYGEGLMECVCFLDHDHDHDPDQFCNNLQRNGFISFQNGENFI